MKNKTNTNLAICTGLTLALALAIGLTVWSPVQAQDTVPAEKKMGAKMMERCEEMKAQKLKMKEEMKVQAAALTTELTAMNGAADDKKMGLMAAVLTHMVEQRIAMDVQMATMHEDMMQHMMRHMKMGEDSMAQCPMMKEMKTMDEKAMGGATAPQAEKK